jgi:type IV pilus assembly protein PilM
VFLRSKEITTGLDIGTSSVKVVRLSHKGSSLSLIGIAVAEIVEPSEPESEVGAGAEKVVEDVPKADARNAPGEEFDIEKVDAAARRRAATIEAIRQALEAAGADVASKPTVVSAVSGRRVSIKHVPLPRMTEEELVESIRWEAKRHLPFDVTQVVLGYQVLEREDATDNEQQMQVLLTAAEKTVIDEHIGLLIEAGIQPDIVDVAPLALMNEVDEEGLMNGRAVAVMEIGRTWANLSVYMAGSLFFARSFPMFDRADDAPQGAPASDASPIDQTAADIGRAPWLTGILRELRFSLTFYNNETGKLGIEALYLAGGHALMPGITRVFEEALGVPTHVLNPLERVRIPSGQTEELVSQGPRFALAMALARRR